MQRFLIGRVAQAVLLLFLVTLGVFLLIRAVPGGPELVLFPEMSLDQAREMRERLGLDENAIVQYVGWLGDLARGELGRSYVYSVPVTELLQQRLPSSLLLLGTAISLGLAFSLAFGIAAALSPGSTIDRIVMAASAIGLSIPVFWLGIVLIIVFAVNLQWLPPGGSGSGSLLDVLRHLILPAAVLGLLSFAELVRYVRTAVAGEVQAAYVTTARSKGLPRRHVLSRHVLRNALIPIVTVLGLQMRTFVSGAAITETVFAWPGMGRLAYEGAFNRDYPVMMGVTLVAAFTVITLNLLVDVCYAYIDPRIRYDT